MQWRTEIPVSRAAELDAIGSGIEVDINPRYTSVRDEREILIETIEGWLDLNEFNSGLKLPLILTFED